MWCLGSLRSYLIFSCEISWGALLENFVWTRLFFFGCILFLWVCLWNIIAALNGEVHATGERSRFCPNSFVRTQFNYPWKVYSDISVWTSHSLQEVACQGPLPQTSKSCLQQHVDTQQVQHINEWIKLLITPSKRN